MTDRVHSLTVVLDRDIRTDDIEPLIRAISMLRGVIAVHGQIADSESYMAEERAKRHFATQLWKVLEPK